MNESAANSDPLSHPRVDRRKLSHHSRAATFASVNRNSTALHPATYEKINENLSFPQALIFLIINGETIILLVTKTNSELFSVCEHS